MSAKERIPELFGSMVFNERTMEQYVPQEAMEVWRECLKQEKPLPLEAANDIADAMKNWALEHGATHFTHWFQPLTGVTAEKHEGFIKGIGGGRVIMDFSGKELVCGEPDASSFPSGGLRATFEARGYSAWDPTSFAFIKDGSLCIPTVFCSYGGEALDKKTPLLRSMEAVSREAVKILRLFGDEKVRRATPQIGAEQEYFLIDRSLYLQREDLRLCGRTLFGNKPPKGQELDDHYFGAIRPRVAAYMKDLDEELWKLGVLSKTKHNEVAPAQHELAPIFTNANRAIDENLLTMEKMRLLASHHGLVCLQHEKPFEGINGSGKHNNWSICAGKKNLFDPGVNPQDNLRFLVFLTCVIECVDEYQELLRMSVASAGNDHRLGANEAPPAIVSIFLGDELNAIVDALVGEHSYKSAERVSMDLGVDVLPSFLIDNTDRNRTSPFAFTGNRFEFRMPGSAVNLADANMILNTAMAKSLKDFADAMGDRTGEEFEEAAIDYIKQTLRDHQRIIFGGDGYSQEWEEEAARRGLANHKTTADALPCYVDPKSIALFEEMHVLSETEVRSRYEVKLEKYNKLINIEANVMDRMVRRAYLPALNRFAGDVAGQIQAEKGALVGADVEEQEELLRTVLAGIREVGTQTRKLKAVHEEALAIANQQERANCYAHTVLPVMEALRSAVDAMEVVVDREYWPVPTYDDMLFYC